MVLACCADDPKDLNSLLPEIPLDPCLVDIPSTHLIGMSDPFKAQSESMSRMFYDSQVIYLPGGHSIPKGISSLERIQILKKIFELEFWTLIQDQA